MSDETPPPEFSGEDGPGAIPAAAAAAIGSAELEATLVQHGSWQELVSLLLERSERVAEASERVALLRRVAGLFEQQLGDAESAFVTLQAALGQDGAGA